MGSRFFWRRIGRPITHFFQRRVRGWDNSDLWSLDVTVSDFVLPRLRRFRDYTQSYPSEAGSYENWQMIIDEMIFYHENFYDWPFKDKWIEARVEHGRELWAQYYNHLWS